MKVEASSDRQVFVLSGGHEISVVTHYRSLIDNLGRAICVDKVKTELVYEGSLENDITARKEIETVKDFLKGYNR